MYNLIDPQPFRLSSLIRYRYSISIHLSMHPSAKKGAPPVKKRPIHVPPKCRVEVSKAPGWGARPALLGPRPPKCPPSLQQLRDGRWSEQLKSWFSQHPGWKSTGSTQGGGSDNIATAASSAPVTPPTPPTAPTPPTPPTAASHAPVTPQRKLFRKDEVDVTDPYAVEKQELAEAEVKAEDEHDAAAGSVVDAPALSDEADCGVETEDTALQIDVAEATATKTSVGDLVITVLVNVHMDDATYAVTMAHTQHCE